MQDEPHHAQALMALCACVLCAGQGQAPRPDCNSGDSDWRLGGSGCARLFGPDTQRSALILLLRRSSDGH